MQEFYHWTRSALCGDNPDFWWDSQRRGEAIHQCLAHCPVLAECREKALQVRPSGGVMAGFKWVPATNCSVDGRPSYHHHPVVCDQCKERVKFPCPYCGQPVEGEKVYIARKIAHPECKEQYGRELEEAVRELAEIVQ